VTSVTVPITTDPFPFRWEVEASGYEWVKGRDSQWRLTPRASGGPKAMLRIYTPLRDDRLFLRFAGLKTTRPRIRKFADRYGVLFSTYSDADLVRHPPGPYSISQLYGTSFGRWKSEVELMRALVRIWKAVKGGRKDELKKVIFWNDKDSVRYRLGPFSAWLAMPGFNEGLIKRFGPDDVIRPAMYALQNEINRRIADNTSPTYVAIVPRLAWCPGPRVERIAKPDHHQRMFFQPTNLLAAMWLQFARAVVEEYQLRVCEGCGEYFQIGKGARRMHAQTCSSRCRQRLSRSRRHAG
jgi:hypothetical protein